MAESSPREEAMMALARIESYSSCEREFMQLEDSDHWKKASLVHYIDRVRNLLQALEACAASLESEGGK